MLQSITFQKGDAHCPHVAFQKVTFGPKMLSYSDIFTIEMSQILNPVTIFNGIL
jgi:hypothetical protein